MPNYQADPDIRDIFTDGKIGVPSGLDPAEANRVTTFMDRDRAVVQCFLRGERPPDATMMTSVRAAMAVYEQRTERLPLGWQKFVVLQAGTLGIELDSGEVMRWAYRLCKDNPGWLGDFDDDVDRGKPLRAMTQAIPATSLIDFRSRG
jgi:hypothetical protein